MRILLTMKLADRSMANHVQPIAALERIERIVLVRDTPGPQIDKVTAITPTGQTTSPVITGLKKLFRLLRSSLRDQPSLVHGYLLFPHGYFALIAGKLTGRKTGVSLIAGPVETYIFGASPIKLYAYCNPLPPPGMVSRIILFFLHRFDIITVTGTYTKEFLIGRGFDPQRIFILPHVVDERFAPMKITKEFDLVSIGRLAPVKHVETFIRAVAHVAVTIPAVRAVIVGDGEEREALQRLAASLHLENNLEFVGFQDRTWEWYNRSRLSVITSEREGFPYTVIESLMCGVPTIVSDCGDIKDIVKDTVNGRVIADYSDHRAFAETAIELLSDPGQLDELSRNCPTSLSGVRSEDVSAVWDEILTHLE